jgi:hypothetical protein
MAPICAGNEMTHCLVHRANNCGLPHTFRNGSAFPAYFLEFRGLDSARETRKHLRAIVMGIEDFIKDALHKPNDYIAYHVGRELAELHPEKAIVEGNTGCFDLEAFVRAEKCSIVEESSVFNHIRTNWERPGKAPRIQTNPSSSFVSKGSPRVRAMVLMRW